MESYYIENPTYLQVIYFLIKILQFISYELIFIQ